MENLYHDRIIFYRKSTLTRLIVANIDVFNSFYLSCYSRYNIIYINKAEIQVMY